MRNKVKDLINSVLENNGRDPIAEINENTHLRNDIGLQSLDLAELTVKIEREFHVDVFEAGVVQTVGEIEARINNG